MTNKLARRLIIVVASVAIGGTAYFLGTQALHEYFKKKFSPGAPGPVTVTAIKAELSAWQPELTTVGTLRAYRGVEIAPEVAGLVRVVQFTSGQAVKAGEVLVELNHDADSAQLTALEAAADLADIVLKRDTVQFQAQAISQAQMDVDTADLKSKRAQVATQRALVEKKILRAPFAGRVGIRTVNPGQYINAGEKIVTLQAINPILVDFSVPQQDASRVAQGGTVALESDAFAGTAFTGKVSAVNPRVDPSTRNIQIEGAVANNTQALLPGMFVRVRLASGSATDQVTLPQSAITYSAYGSSVYVIKEGEAGKPAVADEVFVKTGATRGDQVVITKGVSAGQMVVTSGQMKLKPGSQVKIDNSVSPKNDPNPAPQEQ